MFSFWHCHYLLPFNFNNAFNAGLQEDCVQLHVFSLRLHPQFKQRPLHLSLHIDFIGRFTDNSWKIIFLISNSLSVLPKKIILSSDSLYSPPLLIFATKVNSKFRLRLNSFKHRSHSIKTETHAFASQKSDVSLLSILSVSVPSFAKFTISWETLFLLIGSSSLFIPGANELIFIFKISEKRYYLVAYLSIIL